MATALRERSRRDRLTIRAAPRRARGSARRIITYVIAVPVCIAWIYPFLWMMSASVKPNGKVFSGLGLFPTRWYFSNWTDAWTQAHIGREFFNTVIITVAAVAIVVLTTSSMGYVLGRFSFPGKRILIVALGVLIFLPQGYTIIPIVDLITALHLDNNLFGVILAESGTAHIIQLLLFAGYFRQLPKELEESAVIDGAGFFRVFVQIFLPLAKPVIATVIILQFIASWERLPRTSGPDPQPTGTADARRRHLFVPGAESHQLLRARGGEHDQPSSRHPRVPLPAAVLHRGAVGCCETVTGYGGATEGSRR